MMKAKQKDVSEVLPRDKYCRQTTQTGYLAQQLHANRHLHIYTKPTLIPVFILPTLLRVQYRIYFDSAHTLMLSSEMT